MGSERAGEAISALFWPSVSIVVHAAMGEETTEPGTKTLLVARYGSEYGVVLEPTDFRTVTSTKGLVKYEITVAGSSSHASRPDQGTNAITDSPPVETFRELPVEHVDAPTEPWGI